MSRSTKGTIAPMSSPGSEGRDNAALRDDGGAGSLLSIIVPTYGRPERLRLLVDQLVCQDLSGHRFEVIVVDDGSPEPLAPVLEPIASGSPVPFRLLRKPNGGPASA